MNTLDPSVIDSTCAYQRVAVFGAGLSGQAARRLALSLGSSVCLFDQAGGGDVSEFSETELSRFDAFIFSPGFAAGHPWRVLVQSSGLPCFSELGFAAQYWKGQLLAVTGTNGKTTITSLLCQALGRAGISAVEAGNIGTPLSDVVLSDVNQVDSIAVCEVSSFQAELSIGLELDGLIWSNFAEDHLDRYESMDEYFSAKARLLDCLKPEAPAVLGTDVLAFNPEVERTYCVSEVDCALAVGSSPQSPFELEPQRTNLALAATLWRALKLPESSLMDAANSFELASHRLSPIAAWGGVTFWNDSKATNFHAAVAAVDALDGPIYWIGGGSGKGGDLDVFARQISSKIRAAFVYGEVAEPLAESLSGAQAEVEIQADFSAAVTAATQAALVDVPAVVLLSPGFASFDQFSSYSERGKTFISTVFSLKDALLTS